MHPTAGGLIWNEVRNAALRVHALCAGAAILLLAITLPSCTWVRSNIPGQAAAPVTVPHLLEAEPEIRVRLATETASVAVDGSGTAWVGRFGGIGPSTRVQLPIVITKGAEGWWILSATGDRELLPIPSTGPFPAEVRRVGDQPLQVRPTPSETNANDPGWEIAGRLALVPKDETSEGVFDVIEHVGTEVYLAGVLAAELPWDWSLEAQKAQAVAARSYALHERQRRMGRGLHFDVESDTRSQAYSGLRTHDRARQAVRETGGLVLMEGNAIVRAYYSSTCGGRQQNARHIWPIRGEWAVNLAPAINAGVTCNDCNASPRHRWTVTRTRAQLREALRAYGTRHGFSIANIGPLKSVTVTERATNGRPITYTITDEANKSFTLTAEHLRQAANTGLTPEQLRQQRVPSGDLEIKITGEQATITGQGFGHGVGLCQYGAEGKAQRGLGWQTILRDYYPTAHITPFYGNPADRPGFTPERPIPTTPPDAVQ